MLLVINSIGNQQSYFNWSTFFTGLFGGLIPAIISGLFSLFNMRNSNKTLQKINKDTGTFKKELNDTNNDFQNKITRQQISANIKAQSRINWIQDVRKATVELISSYFEYWSSNQSKDDLIKVYEKTIMLSLYFSDKSTDYSFSISSESLIEKTKNINDELINDLKKSDSNKNKNAKLVGLILSLYSALESHAPEETISITQIDIENRLLDLREIISLYLKIEWDRAKNNED